MTLYMRIRCSALMDMESRNILIGPSEERLEVFRFLLFRELLSLEEYSPQEAAELSGGGITNYRCGCGRRGCESDQDADLAAVGECDTRAG